jgi:hypothetical protein
MAKQRDYRYLSVRMPPDTYEHLQRLADRHHRSMNAEIVQLLEEAIRLERLDRQLDLAEENSLYNVAAPDERELRSLVHSYAKISPPLRERIRGLIEQLSAEPAPSAARG